MSDIAGLTIKQGNTLPRVRAYLRDASGSPLPMESATVRWMLYDPAGTLVVDQPATVLDATTALAEYPWTVADTSALAGWYRGHFRVTYTDGALVDVPNDSFISIAVTSMSVAQSATLETLRRMLGDRIPASGDDTDTFWTNIELDTLYTQNREDLNLAALAGWIEKAAYYSDMVTTVELGSDRRLSDLHKHAMQMVNYYTNLVGPGVVVGTGGSRVVGTSAAILRQNAEEGVGPIDAPLTPEMFSVPSRMSLPGT